MSKDMNDKLAMAESKATLLAAETTTEGRANLKLWKSVEKTPPDMTKDVKFGKRHYTTVDPQWQLRVATALWGPYGHRWGMRNIKYNIVEMKVNDKIVLETRDDQNKIVQSVEQSADFIKYSIILEADFFYPVGDGETAEFQIINDDKYQADDDVLKKIMTNTRSKALSWLGFSADVFLGKFDDTNYVKDLKLQFGDQDAFVIQAAAKIRTAKDVDALKVCDDRLNELIAHGTLNDPVVAQELRELVEERKRELKTNE